MWGGSKVPPSRPLRTSTRIGSARFAAAPSASTRKRGTPVGRRQEIQTAGVACAAKQVRKRIGVSPVHPHREMERFLGVGHPRLPNHGPRLDAAPRLDRNLREIGDRRPQAATVVDGHRLHAGHTSRKSHRPLPAGADRASVACRQIDAPVPLVEPGRCKGCHHPPGNRRLQAEEDCDFDNHVNLFARRLAKVSTTECHRKPFAPIGPK
jgi:hypothetical protein